jgi:hypothetical protein
MEKVSLAEGDVSAALVALRRAASVWQSLEAPYEVAQVRVLLSACRAVHPGSAPPRGQPILFIALSAAVWPMW